MSKAKRGPQLGLLHSCVLSASLIECKLHENFIPYSCCVLSKQLSAWNTVGAQWIFMGWINESISVHHFQTSVIGTIPQPQTHSGLFSLTKPFIDPNVPTTTILFLPWISDIFFKQTIQACCSSSSPSPHTAVWFLLTEAAETMAQVVTNPSAPGLSTLPHIPADRDPWLSLPLLPWMYCVPWSSSST